MSSKTYEEGVKEGKVEGKLEAIEDMQVRQNERLDGHNKRISNLERLGYILLGAVAIIEFLPHIQSFVNG